MKFTLINGGLEATGFSRSKRIRIYDSDNKAVPYCADYCTETEIATIFVKGENGIFQAKDGQIITKKIHLPGSYVVIGKP